MYIGIVEHLLIRSRDVTVVILIPSEHIQFLFITTHFLNLREHVVASLNTHAHGILANHRTLHGRIRGMGLRILDGVELICITHIAIISLTAHNPVPAVQRQVYGADGHRTFHIIIRFPRALQVVGIGVVC